MSDHLYLLHASLDIETLTKLLEKDKQEIKEKIAATEDLKAKEEQDAIDRIILCFYDAA